MLSLSAERLAELMGWSDAVAELNAGLTGGAYIVQSHVHLHTYTHRRVLFADIFVCGEFDSALAVDVLVEAFALERVETRLEERGADFFLSFPRQLPSR